MGKILKNMAVKVDTDSEYPVLVESKVVDESKVVIESKVIDEPESEIIDDPESEIIDKLEPESKVKESLIKTLVDLSAEPTMELLSYSPATRVPLSMKSSDMSDHFQIFLQEIGVLICGLVFSKVELSCYVVRILFELR